MSDNAPTPSRSEIRALAERLIAAKQAWHALPDGAWDDDTPELEAYDSAENAFDRAITPETVLAILADGEDAERWQAIRPHLYADGDATDHAIPDTWTSVYLREENPLTLRGTTCATVEQIVDAARSVSRPTRDGDPREVDRG